MRLQGSKVSKIVTLGTFSINKTLCRRVRHGTSVGSPTGTNKESGF